MFKRPRRTGINWPLPKEYTPERLEEELYAFNLEKRRPDWPLEFKIRMADLTLQPGAWVAQIAREDGINDNLLFNWRNLHRQRLLGPASRATFIPVTVEPLSPPYRHNGAVLPDQPPVISCKLTLPGGSLSLTGPLTPELLRTLVSELRDGEA